MKHVTGRLMVLVCALAGFVNLSFVSGQPLPGASDVEENRVRNDEEKLRDNESVTPTPFDQAKGSDQDIEMTRRIRQSLMEDSTLSLNAHNIKIVTLNGKATLRGQVDNQDERRRILNLATLVVGMNNVINLLEVTK